MAFKQATMQQAFLKFGGFGLQGSGKTYTATSIAIGLHNHIGSKKPVFFIDTETGSDFVIHRFNEAEIKLEVDKTRAFKDLLSLVDYAEKEGDILIIDSITHFWIEFIKAYKTANHRRFLRIQDWGPLKEEWQRYTDKYINSNLHIIMCGRSANIFQDVEDDDDGSKKWKAVKVGTKMKAETETGYEPSLLVEFEKVYDEAKGKGGAYMRRCHVIKDRFDVIDSKDFDNPTFEDMLPHIELLNIGGKQMGVDTTRTSEDLFDKNGDLARQKYAKEHDILLEDIKTVLIKSNLDGTSNDAKKGRVQILENAFGTASWTAIENLKNPMLEDGIVKMKDILADRIAEGD